MDLGAGTGRWEPTGGSFAFLSVLSRKLVFLAQSASSWAGVRAGPRVGAAAPARPAFWRAILLLLFVTCLVTVTNLMLVIMKEPRGRGVGGHPERGFRGFFWGFLFSVFLFYFFFFLVCLCVLFCFFSCVFLK